jgi:hypothetical protein
MRILGTNRTKGVPGGSLLSPVERDVLLCGDALAPWSTDQAAGRRHAPPGAPRCGESLPSFPTSRRWIGSRTTAMDGPAPARTRVARRARVFPWDNLRDVDMAPPSQTLEPPRFPGRFTRALISSCSAFCRVSAAPAVEIVSAQLLQ